MFVSQLLPVARATSILYRTWYWFPFGFAHCNRLRVVLLQYFFKVFLSSDTYTCFACTWDACAEFAECARFALILFVVASSNMLVCECILIFVRLVSYEYTITITYCAQGFEFLSIFGPLLVVMRDELNTL